MPDYLCNSFINVCKVIGNICSELDTVEDGVSAKPKLEELGPFAYCVVIITIFALIISFLMIKSMVSEKPENDLDQILTRIQQREQEERQRIDRLRLLRTRNKVHRWLVYRNAPARPKKTSPSPRKSNENRRMSVTDFMTSVYNNRIKSPKINRRTSLAIAESKPDIVVTDDTSFGYRKRFDTRWPMLPLPLEEVHRDGENERKIQRGSSDSSLLSTPLSPKSMMSLRFDFDIESRISCEESDDGFGSTSSIPLSVSPSANSFHLSVPKLSSCSIKNERYPEAEDSIKKRARRPAGPRRSFSVQEEN